VNSKSHLSKGLQSPSALVQHCTTLALIKSLTKMREVLEVFDRVSRALEESEEEGQWCRRRRELQREARRRVPEFQVVIALSQLNLAGGADGPAGATPGFAQADKNANETKSALLAECAQRLMWMYQQCLPEVVAEARFDFGKLLVRFADKKTVRDDDDEDVPSAPDSATGFHALRKLHVLRLLKESEQFALSGKMGTSYLRIRCLSKLTCGLSSFFVAHLPLYAAEGVQRDAGPCGSRCYRLPRRRYARQEPLVLREPRRAGSVVLCSAEGSSRAWS